MIYTYSTCINNARLDHFQRLQIQIWVGVGFLLTLILEFSRKSIAKNLISFIVVNTVKIIDNKIFDWKQFPAQRKWIAECEHQESLDRHQQGMFYVLLTYSRFYQSALESDK